MLPLSTQATRGCNPISSECVIWQGPDLNCINVCNGDNVSTVIAKIAELLCSLVENGLEASVDVSAILPLCTLDEDAPGTTIQEITQDIIYTLCNVQNQVNFNMDAIYEIIADIDGLELQQGPQGAVGPQGLTGVTGLTGEGGPAGPAGPAGTAGPAGPAGPAGETGETGATGETGDVGPDGCGISNVEQGANDTFLIYTTCSGDEPYVIDQWQGPIGPQGEAGVDGPQGPQGPGGPQGPQGDQGESLTITSTVNNGDGTFTWFFSDGTEFDGEFIEGPQGDQGEPGDPGEIKVVIPECFLTGYGASQGALVGNLYDNMVDPGQNNPLTPGDTMFLQTAEDDYYSEIINWNYDPDNYGDFDDNASTTVEEYQYSGWTDFVNQKLCCLLNANHGSCTPKTRTDDPGIGDVTIVGEGQGLGTGVSNSHIARLPIITTLKNQIREIERGKGGAAYVPPKVVPKYIGKKGQRMEMNQLLELLEKDYGKLKQALGTAPEILKASKASCVGLNTKDRLSGNGTMTSIPGWNTSPSNLAQSFGNAWKTICDMRTALDSLQTTVTPSGCTGFTYDPKVSLIKNQITGAVSSIKFLFTSMVIPDGFYDCDKVKGTKITVEDSSLNTYIDYVQVNNYLTNTSGFSIAGLNGKGLDLNSNFKIKIDFCFTDGSHQCERIMEFTLENSSACPTVTLTTTGETSVEYSVTKMSTVSKSTYEVIIEDQSGSMISKQTIKSPTATSTTGKTAGLIAGTKYDIYVQTTSLSGNISTCDRTTFTTTSATCTSYSKTSSDYLSTISSIGTTKLTLATDRNGATTTAWIVGFNSSTGLPEVYKGTDSTETGTDGHFVLNTTAISDNPTTSISCGNVAYPASGMTTTMNSNENGWQYVGSLKKAGATTYYIYALANTVHKTIDQVVFCCDCKPSYVRTKYGDTSTISTSEAYAPDRHAWYAVTSKTLRIPINIVGYSTQTTSITWNATSTLGGATSFVLPSDSTYDSNLGGTVQLKYTPNATRPASGIDSVEVYAETDCTIGNPGNRTINTITIPIVDASTVQNTDTDITVFVDTNILSEDEATIIKTEMERVKTLIQSNCSTWTGTINYVPVAGGNSGDYLEYTKSMVDKANGASGSITVAPGYSSFKSLPSYWASGGSVPSTVYLICFIGDVNSKGNYGGANLSAGWGLQPTAKYQQNYDELLDILYVNGSARTSWGTSQGCTYKKFDLKQVLVPIVSSSQDVSAATVLQTAGALTGTVLSETGLKGFPTGSVKNPINIDGYIGPDSSQMVPYTGTTVGGSNTISGLYNYGFKVVPFIDKSYLTTDSNLHSGGDQSNFIGNAIMRVTGIDTSGMELTTDTKCPTGTDSVQIMSGTLNGDPVSIYATDSGDTTNCTKAGTAAITASNCINLYNTTGVQFDPSVPTYLSAAGGNAGAVTNQPVDGAYYAQHGAATTNSVRRVAQYDRDGATTGIYWVNIKYVTDC